MRKIELCFEMCYENAPHTEIIEVDDDTTEEEIEEYCREMVLDYANTWYNEIEEEEE